MILKIISKFIKHNIALPGSTEQNIIGNKNSSNVPNPKIYEVAF